MRIIPEEEFDKQKYVMWINKKKKKLEWFMIKKKDERVFYYIGKIPLRPPQDMIIMRAKHFKDFGAWTDDWFICLPTKKELRLCQDKIMLLNLKEKKTNA